VRFRALSGALTRVTAMPLTAPSATLMCSACGRTFEKPRSTLQKHTLVACPHCAALQAARPVGETDVPPPPPAGVVRPAYRKGP
jgi:DNA replicative helicase MCM subunit Mcm2 (Cdc46/Mcm family)